MQIIRDLQSIHHISNPAIRDLVRQRVQNLTAQGFSIEDVGHFAVVDATDTVATIEQHLGVSINSYELVAELPCCFDLVYVLDQAGKGVEFACPRRLA